MFHLQSQVLGAVQSPRERAIQLLTNLITNTTGRQPAGVDAVVDAIIAACRPKEETCKTPEPETNSADATSKQATSATPAKKPPTK